MLQERCWGDFGMLTSLTVSFSLRLARSSCTPAASTAVLERALSCAEGFCEAALSHLRFALQTHSPQETAPCASHSSTPVTCKIERVTRHSQGNGMGSAHRQEAPLVSGPTSLLPGVAPLTGTALTGACLPAPMTDPCTPCPPAAAPAWAHTGDGNGACPLTRLQKICYYMPEQPLLIDSLLGKAMPVRLILAICRIQGVHHLQLPPGISMSFSALITAACYQIQGVH